MKARSSRIVGIALIIFSALAAANPKPSIHAGATMTTRATVQAYFDRLKLHADWQTLFADGVVYTQYTSPQKRLEGKTAFLDGTKRFYSSVASLAVRNVLVEGPEACVTTHYLLQRPAGLPIESDVAELFEVHDGKITSFSIYFDTAPFPK
jgi:ketosteroid isomerase-like protein